MSEYLLSKFELHGVRYVIDPPLLTKHLKEEDGYLVYADGRFFDFCDIATEGSGDWVAQQVRDDYQEYALADDGNLSKSAIAYKRALLARCKPQG